MLSSSRRGAPAASASSTSARVAHSTSSGRSGRCSRARAHRGADAAGRRGVVLLDEDRVEQAEAVVRPAARGDRGLLERAQPRRRLARVEDPRAGALDLADRARGRGRDARQAAEEVQRRALGGQDRPRRALDAQHLAALAPDALLDAPLEARRPGRARGTPARPPSSPKITPGAFWVIVARARASAGTVAAVVASPSPTSSASARRTTSAKAASRSKTVGGHARNPCTRDWFPARSEHNWTDVRFPDPESSGWVGVPLHCPRSPRRDTT